LHQKTRERDEKGMMNGILEAKGEKSRVFQVMLLHNTSEVEIEEEEQVDFLRVQEHLRHGGSVFITSKNAQKINPPKEKKKAQQNRNEMKTVTAFYFDHV
jgi:hypothetical protein